MTRRIAIGLFCFAIILSAQTNNEQRQEEKEFAMPDYSGWPVEKTETVIHPENPNLSVKIELRKRPKETHWLILTTLTGAGTEQNFISFRAFYLDFSSKDSKNMLMLRELHPHDDRRWYYFEENQSELKVGPKDFPKVAQAVFNDLVSSFKETAVSPPAEQAGF